MIMTHDDDDDDEDSDNSHLIACRSSNISATTIPASINTSTHIAIWNGLDSNNFTDLARHLTHKHEYSTILQAVVVVVVVIVVAV